MLLSIIILFCDLMYTIETRFIPKIPWLLSSFPSAPVATRDDVELCHRQTDDLVSSLRRLYRRRAPTSNRIEAAVFHSLPAAAVESFSKCLITICGHM